MGGQTGRAVAVRPANKSAARREVATAAHVPGNQPPPYPRPAIGRAGYDIADDNGGPVTEAECAGPHFHYYVGAYNTIRADETFGDYSELDVVATGEERALQRAKAMLPSAHYFRVARVTVHEPQGDVHA